MSQGHIKSIVPLKSGVAPIDSNTTFFAPYDEDAKDIIGGLKPIGDNVSLALNSNSTSHVSIENLSFLGGSGITIGMWINPVSWTNTAHVTLISTRPDTDKGFTIFKLGSANTIHIDYGGAAQRFNTGYLPPLNKWTHIAYTYDGAESAFYVNGKLHRVAALGNHTEALKGTRMKVGTDPSFLDYSFHGSIYDVAISSRPFSSEEITRMMNNPDMIQGYGARWKFNEGTGSLAYDYSGNGNDAIISDASWGSGLSTFKIIKNAVHDGRLTSKKPTTNLVTNPFFLDNAKGWTNASGTIVVDETAPYTSNTLKMTSNGVHIMRYQDVYGLKHGTYSYSYFIKIHPDFQSGTIGALVYVYFTDGSFQNAGYIPPDYTKINQWQRISSTFTTNTSKTISYFRLYAPWSNNMVGSFSATAVQLEEGPDVTEFVVGKRESSGSLGNGLLMEESGRNFYSTAKTFGGWQVVDLTNNTLSWEKHSINENGNEIAKVTKVQGTPANHASFRTCSVPGMVTDGTVLYTLSFKAKMLSGGTVQERVRPHRGGSTSGTLTYQDIGDGWYLCSHSTASGSACQGIGFVGDGPLECLVTEPQLEEKSFPTSFTEGTRNKSVLKYPAHVLNPSRYTVSCWVQPLMIKDTGTHQSLLEVDEGDGNTTYRFLLIFESMLIKVVNGNEATQSVASSITRPVPGQWYHIVITFDGTLLSLYVNGKLERAINSVRPVFKDDATFNIGGHYWNSLNGVIDDVRVDDVARTSEEISAWYYQGRNGW